MPVSSIAICKLLFTLTHSQKKLMTVLTSPVDGTSVVIEVPMALSADIGLVKETLPDSLQSTEGVLIATLFVMALTSFVDKVRK